MSKINRLLALMGVLVTLGGCVVNQVTGERELGLVTSDQEIAIGRQQYVPAQQMQGGAYNTDPVLSAYVTKVGKRLATASNIELPYEFVVLNNSTPNAWALPGGKIAINRGLLTSLRNEAELAAVLGHEIAHAGARHGAKRIERGYAAQAVLVGVAIGTSGSDYAGQAVGGTQMLAGLLNQTYSRNAEREADYYGTQFMAKAGYDPYGAVTLQETFVRLSGDKKGGGLLASHPASQERVANNQQLLKKLREEGFTGGELNQRDYARAMARTNEAAPAYKLFDEAQALYQEENHDAALDRVGRALAITPAEAQFHGLRGAIRYEQKRLGDAITNFDRAIARDDQYFFYHLSRGLAYRQQGKASLAEQDLTRSVKLLPTAVAYQNLGELAEASGDAKRAQTFYQQAAQGQGAASEAAQASLVRIELPRNPGKYVRAQVARDKQGKLALQVRNQSGSALDNVAVKLDLQTAGGVRSRTIKVGALKANESRQLPTGIDASQVTDARATVVQAALASARR